MDRHSKQRCPVDAVAGRKPSRAISGLGWEALLTKAFRVATCLTVGLLAATAASTGRAESDEEIAAFYRSRPIIFEVGFSVGSAYDLMGRTVARSLGRHMPGNSTV